MDYTRKICYLPFLVCFYIWLFPGPTDRVLQIKICMENVCRCDAVVDSGVVRVFTDHQHHRHIAVVSNALDLVLFMFFFPRNVLAVFPFIERKNTIPLPLCVPPSNISRKLNLNQFYAGNNGPWLMSSIIQILAVLTRPVWPKVVPLYFANIRSFL